jgi:hypothetical protein
MTCGNSCIDAWIGISFWSVPPKVSIDAWGEAIVEAVDDVLFRDVEMFAMVARTSKKWHVYDRRSLLRSCLH